LAKRRPETWTQDQGALSVKVAGVNHDATAENEDGDRYSPEEELLNLGRNSHPITLSKKPRPWLNDDRSSVRPFELSIFPADAGDRGCSSCDRGSVTARAGEAPPPSLGPGHDSRPRFWMTKMVSETRLAYCLIAAIVVIMIVAGLHSFVLP
jgi:hypothetical protein